MNKYEELRKRVYEIIYPEGIPLEFDVDKRDWEDTFYDGDYEVDTVPVAHSEEAFMEDMSYFMLRHMPVHDWNLPYNEAILLKIRRHFNTLSLQDLLRAIKMKDLRLRAVDTDVAIDSEGCMWVTYEGDYLSFMGKINMEKPLSAQKPDVYDKLIELLT